MSTAASLSLLKGGAKSTVADELAKPAVETEAVETAVEGEAEEIDIDPMTGPQLDALVKEHEIEVPASWWKQENGVKKLTVPEKKAWLKASFEEAPAEEGSILDDGPVEGSEEALAAEAALEPQEEVPAETPVTEAATTLPATTPKAPAKKKAAAAKSTVETPGDDVISDLVHEIENMKEKEAREAVAQLNNETEMTMFKLGGVLALIQQNSWFSPWANFREYVENELGMHYRKASYWVSIYNHLAESKVPWDKVKHLGWTKLKEIAEVLTLENVDDWVKIAEKQTTLQLIESVKAHKNKDSQEALSGAQSNVSTKTFKVHDDQKATIDAALEKAKAASGTDTDTVALEFICLDYLGGQTLAQKLQKMGVEKALEALDAAFPGVNISVDLGDEEAAAE